MPWRRTAWGAADGDRRRPGSSPRLVHPLRRGGRLARSGSLRVRRRADEPGWLAAVDGRRRTSGHDGHDAGPSRHGSPHPVYTPPEHRGRDYEAAVTAAVSQAARDAGAEHELLFTDLANPTSNSLYRRIGFQPVSDYRTVVA
ncbi:GNAT family N-acetyltransferase [Streptomyces althioticus]|uniref:GNAT family N-acetyltransferase n=1 Tax=Streptomyces althioticus TaxID=83380 RepID=UPI00368DFBA7